MSAPLRIRLKELNEDLAKMLSECYAGRTPLIFPEKRNRERRVSEQESRVLFCQLLNGKGLRYSVEAPTTNKYCFQTGKEEKPRSGNTDMCIYDECDKKIVNIELKSGQPGSKGISISKDLEKLICENVECDSSGEPVQIRDPLVLGNWFHTHVIRKPESGVRKSETRKEKSLPTLLEKFHKNMIDVVNENKRINAMPDLLSKLPIHILFSFIVLDEQTPNEYDFVSEWFDFDGNGSEKLDQYSERFFVKNDGILKSSHKRHHV